MFNIRLSSSGARQLKPRRQAKAARRIRGSNMGMASFFIRLIIGVTAKKDKCQKGLKKGILFSKLLT